MLESTARVSRDGLLEYRLPRGWFDVTADSQAVGRTIWALKNDYRGSIVVDEVHADQAAGDLLAQRDLLSLARLLLPLVQSEKQAVVEASPRLTDVGGRTFCVCELMTKDGDLVRYILFGVGRRLYALTILFSRGAPAWSASGVAALQDAFLGSLTW